MRGDGPISYISAGGCVGEAHAAVSRWWVRSRHLFAALAGGSRAELSQRGRRQSVNGQLDQHNQQHRDQNGVGPDDWHDVPCISPEFAHAVLERASLASVIRVGSSEKIAAVVRFARATSSLAGTRSLLRGREERLVLRHRGDRRQCSQPRVEGARVSSSRDQAVNALCERSAAQAQARGS